MNEEEKAMELALRCRAKLRSCGIRSEAATMVLFGMAWSGCGFVDALAAWAEVAAERGMVWPPERWRAEIGLAMLRAYIYEPPELWFDWLVGEVMSIEN